MFRVSGCLGALSAHSCGGSRGVGAYWLRLTTFPFHLVRLGHLRTISHNTNVAANRGSMRKTASEGEKETETDKTKGGRFCGAIGSESASRTGSRENLGGQFCPPRKVAPERKGPEAKRVISSALYL